MGHIRRYRKRPVVIEAVQWLGLRPSFSSSSREQFEPVGPSVAELQAWGAHLEPDAGWGQVRVQYPDGSMEYDWPLRVETAESWMPLSVGSWLIRGVAGEFYPCRDDVFRATYDLDAGGEPLATLASVRYED